MTTTIFERIETEVSRLLTVTQASARAGRTALTIHRWIKMGWLASIKIGHSRFLDPADLKRLVAKLEADGETGESE